MAENLPPKRSALTTSIPALHASSAGLNNTASSSGRKKSPNPRHLAIALHHARNIQARKDTEALILSRIENLIQLPTSPDADPSLPCPEDVTTLKTALVPFQPSDYENLILERNIEGRCGYVLCPEEHRREDPKAKFRIIWGPKGSGPGGRGKEMKVVPKEQLEKWCSDKCAERAMYIQVQLSEQPAWERMEKKNLNIMLLEEARDRGSTQKDNMQEVESRMQSLAVGQPDRQDDSELITGMGRLDVEDQNSTRMLAMERGDTGRTAPGGFRVAVNIFERESDGPARASPPILQSESLPGGSIEGFQPSRHINPSDTDDEDNDVLGYI